MAGGRAAAAILALALGAAGPLAPVAAGTPSPGAAGAMCHPWTRLGPSAKDRQLAGIEAMGGGTALAVGSTGPQLGTEWMRLERWTGSRWATAPGPVLEGSLRSIARVPGTPRAWAVGHTGLQTVIVRWDGHRWTRAPVALPGILMGVDVAPGGATFAVGWRYPGGSTFEPLVLRRTAAGWKSETLPDLGVEARLYGVSARSGTDVWAVGWRAAPVIVSEPLVLHRDASGWHEVTFPSLASTAMLMDVVAGSSGRVTAVGWVQAPGEQRALVLDRSGGAWTETMPGSAVGAEILERVVIADGATWAVGTAGLWGEGRGVILRRVGSGGWSARTANRSMTPLSAFARVARGRFLAVGGQLDGLDVRSVVACG